MLLTFKSLHSVASNTFADRVAIGVLELAGLGIGSLAVAGAAYYMLERFFFCGGGGGIFLGLGRWI